MLYQYRTSPVAGKSESPIELLEQRRPRTNMPYLGKGDERIKPIPYITAPKQGSHKYPVGASVMHRSPPTPGYYTIWYPAKIKTLLQEPKAYLLENEEGKVFRRTEQHIHLYNEPLWDRDIRWRTGNPPRCAKKAVIREQRGISASSRQRVPIFTYEAPIGNNTKKRRSDYSDYDIAELTDNNSQTSNQQWRERNLRPTPSPPEARARCSKSLRVSMSPPSSLQQSPGSEPRRSRRIQERRSNSDSE